MIRVGLAADKYAKFEPKVKEARHEYSIKRVASDDAHNAGMCVCVCVVCVCVCVDDCCYYYYSQCT